MEADRGGQRGIHGRSRASSTSAILRSFDVSWRRRRYPPRILPAEPVSIKHRRISLSAAISGSSRALDAPSVFVHSDYPLDISLCTVYAAAEEQRGRNVRDCLIFLRTVFTSRMAPKHRPRARFQPKQYHFIPVYEVFHSLSGHFLGRGR